MAEAEAPTYDFTEYDGLNAEKALVFLSEISEWDQYVAFVEHEQSREKPRSTVLTEEILEAYEEGKKQIAEAEASEDQADEQASSTEAQTETVVADPDLLADPNPGTDRDAIRDVPVDTEDEPFVSEEVELARAEERSKHHDQVTALLKERRGYVLYGTDDQVADVDTELDRLGYDGDRDITF